MGRSGNAAETVHRPKTKHMIDLIYIVVLAVFFLAGGIYARWCEKL
jgi:hypothetical protein